jgi:hypothetical protein
MSLLHICWNGRKRLPLVDLFELAINTSECGTFSERLELPWPFDGS